MLSHDTRRLLTTTSLVLVLCGCGPIGPERAPVRGTVTLDDKPLPGAMVVFEPEAGKVSRGFTDDEGRYELTYLRDIKGAIVGRHIVRITTNSEANPIERLPARYHQKTELAADVKKGSNTYDFELRSDGSGE